ncbi:hypothetical protein ACFOZY_13570 [Chungangia koreensis]|uniref:DUF4747 domain-containing protein n=1 Tax=Chungangia koreensis TaxID=752657 RepID=A0ABV8X6B7_9LACT
MATFYTAKFNFNEKIHKIREGEENLAELLEKVFTGINQDARIVDDKDEEITYKFIQLFHDQQDYVLNGTLVKYYDGINSHYDEIEDDVIDNPANNKADYVSFSFDIHKEVIGFVPKQTFTKESFIKYFTLLVEECVPEVGNVVLILINDAGQLEEKFKRIKVLKEIEVSLIPSNSDQKSIGELLEILGEDVKDTNAQNLKMKLTGTIKEPLKKNSKLINEFISLAKKAYAKVRAIGRDDNGNPFEIDSEKHTLLKRPVHNSNRNSLPVIAELTEEAGKIYTAQRANEVMRNEREEGRE